MRSSSILGIAITVALLVMPLGASAQEGFDLTIEDVFAEATSSSSFRYELAVANVGGGPSPPADLLFLWDGEPFDAVAFPELDNGEQRRAEGDLGVPAVGGSGFFEVHVVVNGELVDTAGVEIDLGPVPGEPGDPGDPGEPGEPAGPEDTWPPDWLWPVVIGGGVVVAGSEWVRRRSRRRRWQREAADEPLRGRCRPGQEHTSRSCRPKPRLRSLGPVAIRATDESGQRNPVTAEFGKHSRAARALGAALNARRRGDDAHMAEKLDEAAARLVGAVDGTLKHGSTSWTVDLSGSYEGSSMECTFRRWRCGPDGSWAQAPRRQWKAKAADAATVPIGSLAGCGRRPNSHLVAELRPLLGVFIAAVSEVGGD